MLHDLALVLVGCAVSAGAAAADVVVARSTDPRHDIGTIIDGTVAFPVAAGTSVTLVTEDGRTVRVDGPSAVAPDPGPVQAGGSMLRTLSRLLSGAPETPAMAVFRGKRNASAHVIALGASGGDRCITVPAEVRFSRGSASAPAELLLGEHGGGQLRVPWPALVKELRWPAQLPIRANARYTISLAGDADTAQVRLLTVPGNLPSAVHAIAWMAQQGCDADARRALVNLTG